MLQSDVLGAEEGCQPSVVGGANVQTDIAVELADGDFVELLVYETEVPEFGGASDLCKRSV